MLVFQLEQLPPEVVFYVNFCFLYCSMKFSKTFEPFSAKIQIPETGNPGSKIDFRLEVNL
jgi:hypothetical protein